MAPLTATDYDDPDEGGNAELEYFIVENVMDEVTGEPMFLLEEDKRGQPRVRTAVCCLDRDTRAQYCTVLYCTVLYCTGEDRRVLP